MRKQRGFTMLELMIVVNILGMLAAIAIPSFVKYTRRAATAEPMMQIRHMYDGAAAYYVTDHSDSSGAVLALQFPSSSGPTPATVPAAVKILTAPSDWDKYPGWNALSFSVSDPQRYSYTFTNNGATGAAAVGQCIAQGDLNGNGVYSTFMRVANGSAITSGVQGGAGLYVASDLE